MTPTIPATHVDLLQSDVAVLGTIDPAGRPQLTAVWFLAEGDEVRLSLNTARHKVRNLRANPAVSLVIVDRTAPTRYLELRGEAELSDDPDYAFAARVGAKYHADLRQYDGPGASRVVVTIHPVRVHAVDMTSGR